MNIRTALAFLLTLSLVACTLMGVAATTAEATDAALTEEIEIATIQEIVTVDKNVDSSYELYGMTEEYDSTREFIVWERVMSSNVFTLQEEIVELTAVTYEIVITQVTYKTVGPEFELYVKQLNPIIHGSVLLPLNAQYVDSANPIFGTDGCTGLFGSNIDIVIPYNFNNPEDM